jgi:hypothetical protein
MSFAQLGHVKDVYQSQSAQCHTLSDPTLPWLPSMCFTESFGKNMNIISRDISDAGANILSVWSKPFAHPTATTGQPLVIEQELYIFMRSSNYHSLSLASSSRVIMICLSNVNSYRALSRCEILHLRLRQSAKNIFKLAASSREAPSIQSISYPQLYFYQLWRP